MIMINCRGCDGPSVDVPVPAPFSAAANGEEIIKAAAEAGFEWCGHCRLYFHRVGCFTFHKTGADRPVPFSSRRAERLERGRLAGLEAA